MEFEAPLETGTGPALARPPAAVPAPVPAPTASRGAGGGPAPGEEQIKGCGGGRERPDSPGRAPPARSAPWIPAPAPSPTRLPREELGGREGEHGPAGPPPARPRRGPLPSLPLTWREWALGSGGLKKESGSFRSRMGSVCGTLAPLGFITALNSASKSVSESPRTWTIWCPAGGGPAPGGCAAPAGAPDTGPGGCGGGCCCCEAGGCAACGGCCV